MENRATTIFATPKGIVALDSPVKLKLLGILKKGITSFDELVDQSGKAKSTISVHLDDLEQLNLIQEKTFPNDKRKKYFVMDSICLACSEIPLRHHYDKHLDSIEISRSQNGSFIVNLFHTIRFGMEAYGVDPHPILKKLGNDVGTRIGPVFESDDWEGILNEVSVFWKNHHLGEMKIIESSNLAVLVTNCYHCSTMPNVGKTLCSMDEGMLEGIFSSRLHLNCNVRETECFGTGYDHCKFIVDIK